MTISMDPKRDRAAKQAQAVSEAVNGLCLFLCGPTFEGLKADAPSLLRQWEDEYAPVLRALDLSAARGDSAALRAALGRISSVSAAGFDPESAAHLRGLRGAVRDALAALGIPLPKLTAEGARVCELHGPACPAAAKAGP
jgi:hypothetical protein